MLPGPARSPRLLRRPSRPPSGNRGSSRGQGRCGSHRRFRPRPSIPSGRGPDCAWCRAREAASRPAQFHRLGIEREHDVARPFPPQRAPRFPPRRDGRGCRASAPRSGRHVRPSRSSPAAMSNASGFRRRRCRRPAGHGSRPRHARPWPAADGVLPGLAQAMAHLLGEGAERLAEMQVGGVEEADHGVVVLPR